MGSCSSSEGCDLARHHIAYLHRGTDIPTRNPAIRWLDREVRFASKSSGCASADGKAYCVAKDGIYAYNEDKGGVYVVAVTTGDMLDRLIVDWVLEVAPPGHANPCETGSHASIMANQIPNQAANQMPNHAANHAANATNDTWVLLCVNATNGPPALVGVSVAKPSVLWTQSFPEVSTVMPMFSSSDAGSVWVWNGSGLVQVHVRNGTINRHLTLPGTGWAQPVSRFTSLCVRFKDCDHSQPTFLAAFAREGQKGSRIGAWTVPVSGNVLKQLWAVDTNATVVGQLTVLSARKDSPETSPTVVVTTTEGVLAVQSKLDGTIINRR